MLSEASRLKDFPSLETRTYLNTAAEGIPPRQVIAAIHQYAEDKLLGMDGRLRHEEQWRQLRQQVADAYGMSADEIGICSCSSEAYNLAAMALRITESEEVIINDLDFPAGATPWLQSTYPATVRLWKSRDGALRIEDLLALLGPAVRLVTVSLVSFLNGYRINLGEVVETVRANSSALLAVDVTQALGRVPLDLGDVDLVVSSTHKWILGSHGGGLVGVPKARAREWTVPAGGWFNLENAFDDDRFDRTVTKPGSASFMVGMPNYGAIYATNAAMNYVNSIGVESIAGHADPLVRHCLDELKRLPVDLITPDEPGALAGIIAFRHPKAKEITERLHNQDVHIMSHAGRLRVSIHGYNSPRDVDRFVAALTKAIDDV